VQQKKSAYEARVEALLAWIGEKESGMKDAKFGETLDEAKAAQEALKTYFVTEKPPKIAEKLDIETLFAELQTFLKVNDRAPYAPDAKHAPESLDAAWDALTVSEKTHAKAIRENRHRFIKKEEAKALSAAQVEEFKKSFEHFDQNKDDSLDRMEFKAANAAVGVPFKDQAQFEATFLAVSEGKGTVNMVQYMQYMSKLQEDRDSPDQLLEAFKSLAGDSSTISAAQLAIPPLSDDDTKFLVASMPDKGNGQYDYAAFVQASFTK